MRFVHYGLTSITFEFLTNAVEQKCKTSVSKIAFVVKEFPMPLDLLVHDFDDSLFTRRATCQTKIAHVLDDYNLALARASRRFQLYQPNYARSCSQEGTYIHTYILMIRFTGTHNPHFPRDPMIGWLEEATMCKETRIWFCEKLDSDHGPLSVQEPLDEIQKTVGDNVILMHMCFTSLSWCRWVGCSNDGSSVTIWSKIHGIWTAS